MEEEYRVERQHAPKPGRSSANASTVALNQVPAADAETNGNGLENGNGHRTDDEKPEEASETVTNGGSIAGDDHEKGPIEKPEQTRASEGEKSQNDDTVSSIARPSLELELTWLRAARPNTRIIYTI